MTTQSRSRYFQGELYQRMSDDLHLAGMSQRTYDGYLWAVRQLADFCKRSPEKISEAQLRKFFLHLKNDRHFASGSLRVAFSGIKFFYTRTCRRQWKTLAHRKVQRVKTLPEVLTIAQVHQVIDACTTRRMETLFWTVYSLGLRLQEGLNQFFAEKDERMHMPEYAAQAAEDFRTHLLTDTHADASEKCATRIRIFTSIGGAQDGLVAACRMIVKTLRQRAGIAMAVNPELKEIGTEIRTRTHAMLRSPTPWRNEEFLVRGDDGAFDGVGIADSRMDLLTVVSHELGHVLGLVHDPGANLMNGELPVGVRRTLRPDSTDAALGSGWNDFLLE